MVIPKILGNWKVVLLSFLVATIFWFFSVLGKDYNYRIKYPITFIYNQDSLIAVNSLPEYIDIDVSGGGWNLFRESFWLGSDPISIALEDPATIKYLTHPAILSIISDQLGEFHLNFLFTDTLYIDIDRKVSKHVTFKIDSTQISLDENHRIVSPIVLSPDTASIFGPSSFIDTLSSEYMITLDVEEIDKTFDRQIKPIFPEGWDIYSNPPSVNVKFQVDQFDQLELAVTVETQNFPVDSSVYLTDPNINIRFVVQEALREDYFATDFKVVVDYNLINKMDSTAPAIVIFQPKNVIEVETMPDSLILTYSHE